MKILKKGAEADVYLSSWNGKKSVLKIRKEKKYRNPSLYVVTYSFIDFPHLFSCKDLNFNDGYEDDVSKRR